MYTYFVSWLIGRSEIQTQIITTDMRIVNFESVKRMEACESKKQCKEAILLSFTYLGD
jgi:hypothetical protein